MPDAPGEAGSHTPESIARLPPKLRARLLQRGILKAEELQPDASTGGGAGGKDDPAPAEQKDPVPSKAEELRPDANTGGGAGGKDEPASAEQTDPRVQTEDRRGLELPSSAAMSKASSAVFRKAPPPACVVDSQRELPPMAKAVGFNPLSVSVSVPPVPVSGTSRVSPQAAAARAVYASGPVLSAEAMKRRQAEAEVETQVGDEGEDEANSASAKRARVQEGLEGGGDSGTGTAVSPAASRAAVAKAQGYQAPVWTYEPGAPAAAVATAVATAATGGGGGGGNSASAALATAATATAATPEGPPLPPGWVRVPHEGECYFWNTSTDEVSWEHPAQPKEAEPEKPAFREEHKVLWTDVGKIIGRQGLTLKILKASLGCTVKIPRQGSKGSKGKGKDGKGKGKDKGKDGQGGKGGKSQGKTEVTRGIGTGETALTDDKFATVVITGETKYMAAAGKRTIEIMLGYGRNVERALAALGVEAKMPKLEDLAAEGKGDTKAKDGIDPMDPAAYSDAPVGGWSAGLPKPDGRGQRSGPEPRDSRQANAERF